MEEDDSVPDHKLCGYLFAVLSITPPPIPNTPISQTLPVNTRCHVYADGADVVGFRSDNGVILTAVDPNATALVAQDESPPPPPKFDNTNGGVDREKSTSSSAKNVRRIGKASGVDREKTTGSSAKKFRRIGMVQGSLSVVRQLHQLVAHKCVKVIGRVIKTVSGYCGEARAVLLVDVYLPIAVWDGWQFPKSQPIAAALFRHLSYDWEKRSSVIVDNEIVCNSDHEDDKGIWNLHDCHVLGCILHCGAPDTSKRKLFELHEIFKSLPRVGQERNAYASRIYPAEGPFTSGIWDITDDMLFNILNVLGPTELMRVSVTCRHLRLLAKSVMPCMKLKLFPHQQAAVEWMLQREQDPRVLPHPLYMSISTGDGFVFYINTVSGEIVTGSAPTIRDFRGGMFCDEPGLGKTITALSLILKTQGTMADPPDGLQVTWCAHNAAQRCGYYELSSDNATAGNMSCKRVVGHHARRGKFSIDEFAPRESLPSYSQDTTSCDASDMLISESDHQHLVSGFSSPAAAFSAPSRCVVRCRKSLNNTKRNIQRRNKASDDSDEDWEVAEKMKKRKCASSGQRGSSRSKQADKSLENNKMARNSVSRRSEINETWVQCESCRKWRKLSNASVTDATTAWFCSMNSDSSHQSCSVPEEPWNFQSITDLPGFYTKGTPGGNQDNISFFSSVLKENYTLMSSQTKKALTWLAKLSPEKLSQMETVGLVQPVLDTRVLSRGRQHAFHKLFQAFGLKKQEEQGITRWFYPSTLKNLAFDLAALQIALCEPLDSLRLYLSRATLVVVPTNLVDHWKTQIEKHVSPGQLRVYIWTDHRRPSAHNLAWDYDVVITTFNRLSVEWSPHQRSALMQVHWHRLLLDEGHTLGSSLNLTNKLQMAISLTASSRWLLTGTPTPNTPNSQLSHLQPMLKFLHEEAYGENQKSWEAGILRPFEAEMEDGRSRLLQLLHRCMISERKADLQSIPPCIKKVTFVDFTQEHAGSYNDLVVTVRRNILMADWNDPSHVESLLNPKQWKLRSATIKNVRLSCCVAGHIKISEAGQDIQETMDILVQNSLDPISEEYAFIRHNIQYGGNCMRCKEWCRLPVITPCRHLLCLDCVALDSEKCTFRGCGNLYEMQSPEILARPENPNPKWPVPKDLIELQPSYKQDDWDPDWQSTSSSKVAYLVQKLKDLQEANEMLFISQKEENEFRHLEETFPSSKTNSDVLLLPDALSRNSHESSKTLPHKVIIFSQFLEHIHVIEQQLSCAGIRFTGMYSPMPHSTKMKSLTSFQNDSSCMALVMDGSAALGLDLSFVNHVFLMEPIWDRSMEEQVISRAHRMGASRPIHVETLAMSGTVEEQMLKFLQDPDECRRLLKEEVDKSEREGSRAFRTLHDFAESNYLAHLSFVRTIT